MRDADRGQQRMKEDGGEQRITNETKGDRRGHGAAEDDRYLLEYLENLVQVSDAFGKVVIYLFSYA